MYSLFRSSTFCHFSGNFTIPPSQNFLSCWAKNCFRCLLQSSRELRFFFPLGVGHNWANELNWTETEENKDQTKWTSACVVSGEYGGGIRTSQPSCNSFCLVIRETCSLVLSWWKIMRGLLINFRHFLSSAAFSWSNWEQYLLELIIWFSGRSS